MTQLLLQAQLLLAALSAFLPLAPVEQRARLAEILELAATAIRAGGLVQDAAAELAGVRGELEALVASGRALGAEDFDGVIARVRAASALIRAAAPETD